MTSANPNPVVNVALPQSDWSALSAMLRQLRRAVTSAGGGPSATFFGAGAAGTASRRAPPIATIAADANLTMRSPPSRNLDGTLGIARIAGQEG